MAECRLYGYPAILLNSNLRLDVSWDNHDREYMPHLGIWRIMWRGAAKRVILYGYPCQFLLDTPKCCSITVMAGKCTNRSDLTQGERFMMFVNCHVRNRWIPTAIPIRSDAVKPITVFLELECEDIVPWLI
jgi:hypothetical protein